MIVPDTNLLVYVYNEDAAQRSSAMVGKAIVWNGKHRSALDSSHRLH